MPKPGPLRLTEVCKSAQVYLGISEDAFRRSLVQTIHHSITSIRSEASNQKCAFFIGEEARCFRPVC